MSNSGYGRQVCLHCGGLYTLVEGNTSKSQRLHLQLENEHIVQMKSTPRLIDEKIQHSLHLSKTYNDPLKALNSHQQAGYCTVIAAHQLDAVSRPSVGDRTRRKHTYLYIISPLMQ